MQEISNSIESIMIQGGVGREENELHLSNLPSLITLEIGSYGFCNCNTIVIESMNDWMNDEWDLIRLQSIILGSFSFEADIDDPAIESSSLTMKSMNDMILIRSFFSDFTQRKWLQFQIPTKSDNILWLFIIEFEVGIPKLKKDGIQLGDYSFSRVKTLTCTSMIHELIIIEILLFFSLFDRSGHVVTVRWVWSKGNTGTVL